MKICSTCKLNKPKNEFSKNKQNRDGLQHRCRICLKEYNSTWANNHLDKFKEYDKLARRNWYVKNSDRCKEGQKQRRKSHPEEYIAREAARRAAKLQATPLWFNNERVAIRELYRTARLLSETTGIKHHVDHIVPLKSEIVQGFHCFANLQILSAEENLAKSNQYWPDMP